MDNSTRITEIRARLQDTLSPTVLEITDESDLHLGHPGAASGLGHFTITISATTLKNKTRIQQHKLIYAALGTMMQTDIHALKINICSQDGI